MIIFSRKAKRGKNGVKEAPRNIFYLLAIVGDFSSPEI
jgi:hypothetical protein